MTYLKPQSPLKHKDGDYFYPLTTIDQVITDDGRRLNVLNYMSVDNDGAIEGEPNPVNADTLGGYSPEHYVTVEQIKKAAPRNLLDNSDFRNPVNQRGQTSYQLGAWGGYTIDRWAVIENGAMVTPTPNGLQLYGGLYQPIAEYDRLSGKTVTLAAKVNGEILCCSGTVTYTGEWHRIAELGSDTLQAGITVDAVVETSLLWVTFGGYNATFEWVALYEGEYTAETLPEYQPKGYGVELIECQRYYQIHGKITVAGQYDIINTTVPMRITPSAYYSLVSGETAPELWPQDNKSIMVHSAADVGYIVYLVADF